MQWINNLKIAIIEEDIVQIEKLTVTLPEFNSASSAKEALALISQAIHIVNINKQNTLTTMNKIRKTKAFLNNH